MGDFYTSGTFTFDPFDDREYYKVNFRSVVSSNKYENTLDTDNKFQIGGIQSDIVQEDYLKLFIVYRKRFDWQLGDSFKKVGLSKSFPDSLSYQEKLAYLDIENEKWKLGINDFLKVYLDSIPVKKVQWAAYTHPKTAEEGYITYLNIDSLSSKKHNLSVNIRYDDDSEKSVEERWLSIPFWKE